jgi:hypothetical protein
MRPGGTRRSLAICERQSLAAPAERRPRSRVGRCVSPDVVRVARTTSGILPLYALGPLSSVMGRDARGVRRDAGLGGRDAPPYPRPARSPHEEQSSGAKMAKLQCVPEAFENRRAFWFRLAGVGIRECFSKLIPEHLSTVLAWKTDREPWISGLSRIRNRLDKCRGSSCW